MSHDAASLWRRFHGELQAFVLRRVDSAAAEDILQTAFLRAHKSLENGEAPEQPRAWLYQIVRNLIVDGRRRTARHRAMAEAVASDPALGAGTDVAEDEAFVVVARALPMFIDTLEPRYRDALRMTDLEGLTQDEAARRAGISVSGMKSRVQRGRRRVFELLQQCCEFDVDARGHMTACRKRDRDCGCC